MSRMRALLVGSVVLVASLSAVGCGSSDALCSLEARAAVNVTVKDAATKKPICDAKVVITNGSDIREEPTPNGPDCLYSGAYEKTGTFRVEVTHPSFAPATRENIEAKTDASGCHVEAQQVLIELSK
jgi:hypothetical protein